MSCIKDDVIELVRSLPDDCSLEDIQYHLAVRAQIERGLEAIERGDVVPHTEVERMLEEWLPSSGPGPV
jgi:predicted transcriptional regulator